MDELSKLFNVIQDRRNNPTENSYTSYLFDKGLDKILKKCGEECSEMIIAAKSYDFVRDGLKRLPNASDSIERDKQSDLENEVCDLLYHITVLLAFFDIPLENIDQILLERSKKINNLKTPRIIDMSSQNSEIE